MASDRFPTLLLTMPDGGQLGVIRVRASGSSAWTEFRGRPYVQWDESEDTPMSRLHDMLEGWHTSVLHAGDELALMADRHGELYQRVLALTRE